MIHDEKTTELELPSYNRRRTDKAAQSVQRTGLSARGHSQAHALSLPEVPWVLRLAAAIAVLALSLWIL